MCVTIKTEQISFEISNEDGQHGLMSNQYIWMTLKAFYSKKNLCELAQKLGLITSDGV
jgi:hypothetical protein